MLLRLGDPTARSLFHNLARTHDLLAAWLGEAAAARLDGDLAPAGVALGTALANHALPAPDAVAGLAAAIAHGLGAPGWCCVTPDRRVLAFPAPGGAPARLRIDGRRGDVAPPGALAASAQVAGQPFLGSPLRIARMFRVEGAVRAGPGGLVGWAWHPGVRGVAPHLYLGMEGAWRDLVPSGPPPDGLAAPVGAFGLALPTRGAGPHHVRDPAMRDLAGSPVTAAPPVPHGSGRPADALPDPDRPVAVVIPAFRGARMTLACIARVRASSAAPWPILVVDDATPEPGLARALDRLAVRGAITLIRRPTRGGFPAAANAGLAAVLALPDPHDVVLLNSDALVSSGWLAALHAVVHAAADIGTATPLSNDASLASYPHPDRANPPPAGQALRRLAALAAAVNAGGAIDIPTAVGFCMYVRHECLAGAGLLDAGRFAQGYGEENDFCLRASRLGWRHVAAPGVFVAHLGGRSFGPERAALAARNAAVLEQDHPGYPELVAVHHRRDPLAPARARLDAARWAAARVRAGAVLLVTHDSGGGVERAVRARCAAIHAEGRRPIVLRPAAHATCELGNGPDGGFPNLRFTLPDMLPALVALLRDDRIGHVEIHHLLGHSPATTDLAAALGVPADIHVHDHAWLCARVAMVRPDAAGEPRFCGEPLDRAACDACVAAHGSLTGAAPAALRARAAAGLRAARRVVTPSRDAARRLVRHLPDLAPQIAPLDAVRLARPEPPVPQPRRVVVIGAIGPEKGFDVLLACAREAARVAAPLEFVIVGHTADDAALMATGRVFVTGPYAEPEGEALVRAQRAHLAWLPSICPETWSFALSLAWASGLRVCAFDLGAQAERIAATGHGWLLPLAAPPAAIAAALLAASPHAGDECGHRESAGAPHA